MVPIALDPSRLCLGVAGNGAAARRRLRSLRRAGATDVKLFADAPNEELRTEAAASWSPHLPDQAALQSLNVLWIADLAPEAAGRLAAQARAAKVLVNVEDQPQHCEFHSVAELRRGDLLLTVSTGGAAPGLSGSIRRRLEKCFGDEWSGRVEEVAALRAGWREDQVPMAEAARRIDEMVAARCWLNCPKH